MKLISLTKGRFAIVDDEDFDRVNEFKWYYQKNGTNEYAIAFTSNDLSTRKILSMHRFLMGFPKSKVDHRNGNGLDNRRSNLRVASHAQNIANQKLSKTNTSGFKGVSWKKSHRMWRCRVSSKRKIFTAYFKSATDAALAYDEKAVEIFGEFARTNKSMGLLTCH